MNTHATVVRAAMHGRYNHAVGDTVTDQHEADWLVRHGFAVAGDLPGDDELDAEADALVEGGPVPTDAEAELAAGETVAPSGGDDASLKIPDEPTPRRPRGGARNQE